MSQKGTGALPKILSRAFLLLLLCIPPSFADSRDTNLITPHTTQQPGSFKLIRSDEDYSYFVDPSLRHGVLDEIKFIPLNADGSSYLTLGGQFREEFEYFKFKNWGLYQTPDTRLKTRFMESTDFHFGTDNRIFIELKSGFLNLNSQGPGVNDVDHLAFNQIFYDHVWHVGTDETLTVRPGMSELDYGSERLISVRENANIRLGFLGLKTLFKFGNNRMDTFWVFPMQTNPGVFEDYATAGRQLWSNYVMLHPKPFDVDVYYFGFRNDFASFAIGPGLELRHSFGLRVANEQSRNKNGFDFDAEGVYQFGSYNDLPISAFLLDIDPGYSIGNTPWSPRFGLKVGAGSGDHNQGQGTVGTFDPLFPRSGYLDLSGSLGQTNILNINPYLNLRPSEHWRLTTGLGMFWRESDRDGIYTPGMALIRGPGGSRARYVGSEATVTASFRTSKHLNLVAGYAYFSAGNFIAETGPDTPTRYGQLYVYFIF